MYTHTHTHVDIVVSIFISGWSINRELHIKCYFSLVKHKKTAHKWSNACVEYWLFLQNWTHKLTHSTYHLNHMLWVFVYCCCCCCFHFFSLAFSPLAFQFIVPVDYWCELYVVVLQYKLVSIQFLDISCRFLVLQK